MAGPLAEVWFYQLDGRGLDQVLPTLLERALARGWRAVVQAGGPERVAALDALLWTYSEESFLPHGTAADGEPEGQPVYLTDGPENPNGAAMRVCLDGVKVEPLLAGDEAYQRLVLVFDGRDDGAVADARAQWVALRKAGRTVSYWRQDEDGRWEKRG